MTDKSESVTSSVSSIEKTPEPTLWSPKLGRAVLYRAAKEIGSRIDWLDSDHIKTYCEHSGVDHKQYREAVAFISRASEAQRVILLKNLKRSFQYR